MSKNWKRFELKIAKDMNTSRQLMKGTDIKEDIISDIFCLDAKLQKNFSLSWFDSLREYARSKMKIPVLVYRRPNMKQKYVVIEYDTFLSLVKGAGFIEKE
jgi:hypothetical protein